MTTVSDNPTLARLQNQIEWYDKKSIHNQRWYKGIKLIEIIAAAFIPFAAGTGVSPYVTGGLGVLVTGLEGLQHLNQYHNNWTMYRSTCEDLKHEKYLWVAKAGPYRSIEDPGALLAERVESLISREHAKWVSARGQAEKEVTKPR